MSNIRQRRAPSPGRETFVRSSSTSWEIATDDIGETAGSPSRPKRQSIPMYNPMAIQTSHSTSNIPASSTPSSKMSQRVSWSTIMEAKRNNMEFLRENPLGTKYHDPPGTYFSSPIGGMGAGYDSFRSERRLTSMAPALVPDSRYRAYLSGRPSTEKKKPMVDKIKLAKIMGYFSIVGFIMMTLIGILIDSQPLYLQGISRKNQETSANGRLQQATHAYRGGILYLLTAIACFGYANNMYHVLFKRGWQQYQDVDDVDSTIATFGGKDGYLPTAGAVHRKAYSNRSGFILRTWHTAQITIQRLGIYLTSVWQARRGNRRRFSGAKDV